jgi:pyrroloquinoline quinone biosynthesis protein E
VSRPALWRGTRLSYDPVRSQAALLYPEGVLLLDPTAADVVARCDGRHTVTEIAADLEHDYDEVSVDDVADLVADLAARRLVTVDGAATSGTGPPGPGATPAWAPPPREPVPVGLVAELTYRCPLHCTYCSNPVQLSEYRDELSTVDWRRVLDEARALGVLQVHFSGGEPLLRRDLVDLVGHARRLGMYTNLVTSGVPAGEHRLSALAEAGLDHLQLSIQDADRCAADAVAGTTAHDRKLGVARTVRALGLAFTVNAVLHRGNLGRLTQVAALAADLGADRLELAHTQFYGWGRLNRAVLLPTPEQVDTANRDAAAARARYGNTMEVVYVVADAYANRPKPCMGGWGSRQMVVAPNGDVLPCLAAAQLPGLAIPNIHSGPLADLWYDSPAFNRFRGTGWMPEPCRSCDLREVDFGGCRCQAYQLVGDPAATDPACELSPHHDRVAAVPVSDSAPLPVPRRRR